MLPDSEIWLRTGNLPKGKHKLPYFLTEEALLFQLMMWWCLKLPGGIGFSGGSVGKESACNAGDLDSIPGSGRSPGEGNGNPLQYSCLENPMDRGTWWAIVHRVPKRHDWTTNTFSIFQRSAICFPGACMISTLQINNEAKAETFQQRMGCGYHTTWWASIEHPCSSSSPLSQPG